MKTNYRDSEGNPFPYYCDVVYLEDLMISVRVLKQNIPPLLSRNDWEERTIVSGPSHLLDDKLSKQKIEKLKLS